jgi:hypothetical protein
LECDSFVFVAGDEGVVIQFVAGIEQSISSARLQRYQSNPFDSLETVINYFWNIALAESLYCSLNMVEIALRNGLHNALAHQFGTPTWYDRAGLLEWRQAVEVRKTKARIAARGDLVTSDRVVSELTFGFWVTILSRPYDSRLWSSWKASPLKTAFVRIPRSLRQRQHIHQHYNAIRELRNRVFHHEPIFDDQLLDQRHDGVKRGLYWLNPEMVNCLEYYDRFPDVLRSGRTSIEGTLKLKLNIP